MTITGYTLTVMTPRVHNKSTHHFNASEGVKAEGWAKYCAKLGYKVILKTSYGEI